MVSVPPGLVVEVVISPEMIAAGIEAMKEAKVMCLEDGDVVIEIFLAMYGMSLCDVEVLH